MSDRAINSSSALIYEAPDLVKGSGGEIISQFNRFKLKRSMQGRMDTMEWRPPVKANVGGKKQQRAWNFGSWGKEKAVKRNASSAEMWRAGAHQTTTQRGKNEPRYKHVIRGSKSISLMAPCGDIRQGKEPQPQVRGKGAGHKKETSAKWQLGNCGEL